MTNYTHLNNAGYIVRDNFCGEGRNIAILKTDGKTVDASSIHVDSTVGLELAELFMGLRDESLGNWRSGDWIAREGEFSTGGGRTVRLFNERTFKSYWMNEYVMREETFSIDDDGEREVARRFFKDNPSEPWKDAKAGEVWELETDDNYAKSGKYVASDLTGSIALIPVGHSRASHIGVNATAIKSGYRTYPVEKGF